MKQLNIFVDETGDFGFNKNSSLLYGISFVFHEQKNNIKKEIDKLNEKLIKIGYTEMIHTANLISNRNEYSVFDIKKRKSIFNALYHFSTIIKANYYSIFINKKFYNNKAKLRKKIIKQIELLIYNNYNYFDKFDKIVLYYDNGQETLSNILITSFSNFNDFEHIINFDHTQKKLFQVADMLTFIDKYDYKFKNKFQLSQNEKFFFEKFNIKNILKSLKIKRLKH